MLAPRRQRPQHRRLQLHRNRRRPRDYSGNRDTAGYAVVPSLSCWIKKKSKSTLPISSNRKDRMQQSAVSHSRATMATPRRAQIPQARGIHSFATAFGALDSDAGPNPLPAGGLPTRSAVSGQRPHGAGAGDRHVATASLTPSSTRAAAWPPGVLLLPMVRTRYSVSQAHGYDASSPATSGGCAPSTTTGSTRIRPPPRSSVLFNGGGTTSCRLILPAARCPTRAAASSSSPHGTRPALLLPRQRSIAGPRSDSSSTLPCAAGPAASPRHAPRRPHAPPPRLRRPPRAARGCAPLLLRPVRRIHAVTRGPPRSVTRDPCPPRLCHAPPDRPHLLDTRCGGPTLLLLVSTSPRGRGQRQARGMRAW
jgi:hypothetical protein